MTLRIQHLTRNFLPILLALLLLLSFSGCADLKKTFNYTSIDEEGNEVQGADINLPAKDLLVKGMDDYNVGKYFTAVEFFNDILNRFPFSPEATLAELKAADCSYYLERYVEALALYEEFENRHPTNESIPYVMYQKAMCNYKQIDRVDRDSAGAIKSIEQFNQLLKAYPNSPYTSEAKARIQTATEFLANHEYFVVEYYVRTEKFDQAKVRLKYLLAMYPDSNIAGKAKQLLTRIEAGDPPRSRLTSWFPKLNMPNWTIMGGGDKEDTTVTPQY
ncbi:outer membrane protein assembly factor BamD [Desulfopila sp. IMCC35006]|uniref:outer membrane protein assembly factor BamD n=1 Tax=Desulfopila sp. IMCC35006 TaxID=2569542 RepID=UPI0010AD9D49|nr:outer membrane protein assembly factor BamD [Desulfopila sp. IMCC35006]TKB24889.1 outer membrane protein assembly factor BamD [Desulfopila sp. IMCC35006]